MMLTTQMVRPAREASHGDNTGSRRGFGDPSPAPSRSKGSRAKGKRRKGLSRSDWGPLGKHPDIEAIVARQRLHLPLSGRLGEEQVNGAWKRAAAQHHPDRGGEHDTMQLVNGARDLLLGRDGVSPPDRPEQRRRSEPF
jgi:hypothetical protein